MPQITVSQNHDDPEYKAAREKCDFTASELPMLLGVGYTDTSVAHMIDHKRGLVPATKVSAYGRQIMERGQQLEEPAARCFHRDWLGGAMRMEETGFWVCPNDPLIGATPDRLLYDAEGNVWSLEIKNPINVADKEIFDVKWLAWRIQLEAQIQAVDGCVGGYIFAYCEEEPDNSRAWRELRNDDLWAVICERIGYYRRFLRCLDAEVPRCERGKKKEHIMEWVEREKERRNVKRTFIPTQDEVDSFLSKRTRNADTEGTQTEEDKKRGGGGGGGGTAEEGAD